MAGCSPPNAQPLEALDLSANVLAQLPASSLCRGLVSAHGIATIKVAGSGLDGLLWGTAAVEGMRKPPAPLSLLIFVEKHSPSLRNTPPSLRIILPSLPLRLPTGWAEHLHLMSRHCHVARLDLSSNGLADEAVAALLSSLSGKKNGVGRNGCPPPFFPFSCRL